MRSGARPHLSRAAYVALALLTIVAGLAVNMYGAGLGAEGRDVAGDALWAVMILWLTGVAAPGAPLVGRCVAALLVCAVVELSQLAHGTPLDAIRSTAVGRLMLGTGFDPRDFGAYTLGIVAAGLIEGMALT
jgi:hypothetical protein